MQRCEAEAQAAFGERATATRSQPYYLDVTNKDANKGAVVAYLSDRLSIPAEEIATIGDQPNDVLMFKRSGFSIAMGNASDEVKAQASVDHRFLQRRRIRQGDGAVHSRLRGIADHGRGNRTRRDIAGSAGAGAPCGRMDDGGGARGEGRLSRVAFRRVDAEDPLRAARFR